MTSESGNQAKTQRPLVGWMDRHFYPDSPARNWDDQIFRQVALKHIDKATSVLDVGAGTGRLEQLNFRRLAKKVVGVDLDQRVLHNDALDEAHVCGGEDIPEAVRDMDVVISVNVLEHLDNPERVFRQIHRTLKPGGKFLFKTPNATHYIALISRLTPLAFHKYYNRLRGRDADDTFGTFYRANTASQIASLARKTGFKVSDIRRVEWRPEYLRINAFFYPFGIVYERLVNSSEVFSPFRAVLMGTLEKK